MGEASNPGPPKGGGCIAVCPLCPSQVPQCPHWCETFTLVTEHWRSGAHSFVDMTVDDSDQERPARLTCNRFEVLSDTAEPSEARPRRRLVLISQIPGSTHAVKFSRGTWHQINFGKRKGPSRGIIQKCALHEQRAQVRGEVT